MISSCMTLSSSPYTCPLPLSMGLSRVKLSASWIFLPYLRFNVAQQAFQCMDVSADRTVMSCIIILIGREYGNQCTVPLPIVSHQVFLLLCSLPGARPTTHPTQTRKGLQEHPGSNTEVLSDENHVLFSSPCPCKESSDEIRYSTMSSPDDR